MKLDLQEVSGPQSNRCVLCREPADDAPTTVCERCSTIAHEACAWELSREACPTPGCGAWRVERPSEAALLQRRRRTGPLFERPHALNAPADTRRSDASRLDPSLAGTLTRFLVSGLLAAIVALVTLGEWVTAAVVLALLIALVLWIGAAVRERNRERQLRYQQALERDARRRDGDKTP